MGISKWLCPDDALLQSTLYTEPSNHNQKKKICRALVAAFVSGAAHTAGNARTTLERGGHQHVICPSRNKWLKNHSCACYASDSWHHYGWSSRQRTRVRSQYRHCTRTMRKSAATRGDASTIKWNYKWSLLSKFLDSKESVHHFANVVWCMSHTRRNASPTATNE